jgi:hypothetical protein
MQQPKSATKVTGIVKPGGRGSGPNTPTAAGGRSASSPHAGNNASSAAASSAASANSALLGAAESLVPFADCDKDVLEKLDGEVKGILRDVLSQKSLEDIVERIEDQAARHPTGVFGTQFVMSFIEFALDCKLSEQQLLMNFLQSGASATLRAILVVAKPNTEQALQTCQSILMLCDYLSDCKNAPVLIGSFLRFIACEVKACDIAAALSAADAGLAVSLADDFVVADTARAAFSQLKAAISGTA